MYVSVFVLLLSIISIGYYRPYSADAEAAQSVSPVAPAVDTPSPVVSVDEKTATNVAANFAMQTEISVATNVANLSTSLEAQQEIAQADHTVIAKPQIVQPTADNRAVSTYVAKEGDTVQSIAAEHGISVETVKWANTLMADTVDAGRELVILPVSGVLYTTKAGDTLESLAQKYGASAERIVSYNDLEVAGIQEGVQIIIPDGVRPTEPAPQPQPTLTTNVGTGGSLSGSESPSANVTVSAGNKYAPGYCTFYAYERRPDIGSFWGNASTWAINAQAAGFTVVRGVPKAGAIFQYGGGYGGYGHAGIVESVNTADGTMVISDMNGIAGFNRVGYDTVPINTSWNYIY